MISKKRILVTGGTGNQGGAVVRHLIEDDLFTPVVLSRNPDAPKCVQLKELGVEVVKGNLDEPRTYRQYLEGTYGVFSVQNFTNGIEKEIKQGKLLADNASKQNIQHFVYTSVSGAGLGSGVPHFESKYEIEQQIKGINLQFTIIRPTSFYENLLNPEVKKRILKGKLVMPLHKDIIQEYISLDDIGLVVAGVFNNPDKYIGKTLTIASDKMSMLEMAEELSILLNRPIEYNQLPVFVTRFIMGHPLSKMFSWVNKTKPVFVKDIPGLHKEFPGLTNARSWLKYEFLPKLK